MSTVIDTRSFLDDMLAAEPDTPQTASTGPELELTIRKFVLALLLERAATVIPTRDVMPVLKCFQVEARPDRLRVVATDLELSMIATTPLVRVTQPGTAVFPARKMLDIVREADDGEVHIRVRAGTAAIRIGRTAWNLRLQTGADYPPMPEITEVTFASVERAAFTTALHTVRYAACKDANRASLMMIDLREGRMSACDGARFQQARTATLPFQCQIPIGAVDDLLKLARAAELDEISIGTAEHHPIFSFGTDVLIVNKLAAQFPDMQAQLLRPALENTHPLRVERAELLAAIKRVRITADLQTSAIGLILTSGELSVSARDKFGNHASQSVEADWTGTDRTLVVNHAFLTDMIQIYDGATLHFWLGEDTKTRKAALLLRHPDQDTIGVVQQMMSEWVGA